MAREDKKENILSAAEKRFAHFGVDKTTMNEIAADAGISKASIYYYYPDKLALYAEVFLRIIDREKSKENFRPDGNDLLAGLLNYLTKRTDFIIRNYRILEYLKKISGRIPAELKELFEWADRHDVEIISAYLEKGQEKGTLKIKSPGETARLLHDCLSGLRNSVLNSEVAVFPEKKKFSDLLAKEKEVTTIFFYAFGNL